MMKLRRPRVVQTLHEYLIAEKSYHSHGVATMIKDEISPSKDLGKGDTTIGVGVLENDDGSVLSATGDRIKNIQNGIRPTMEIENMAELRTAHEDQVQQLEASDAAYIDDLSSECKEKDGIQLHGDVDEEIAEDEDYNEINDKDEIKQLLIESRISIKTLLKRYGIRNDEEVDPTSPRTRIRQGKSMTYDESIAALENQKQALKNTVKNFKQTKGATNSAPADVNIKQDVHWDFMLKELTWMSDDYRHERKWKTRRANKLAREAKTLWRQKQQKAEKLKKEKVSKLIAKMKKASRDVKHFWGKIEKIITFKHRRKIDATRRLAMDKHLNFMVKQTERYANLLATASEDLKGYGGHDNVNTTTDDEIGILSDESMSDNKQEHISRSVSNRDNFGVIGMLSANLADERGYKRSLDSDSDFEVLGSGSDAEGDEDMKTLLEEEQEAAKDENFKGNYMQK